MKFEETEGYQEWNAKVEKNIELLKQLNFGEDELRRQLAMNFVSAEETELKLKELKSILDRYWRALQIFGGENSAASPEMRKALLEMFAESNGEVETSLLRGLDLQMTSHAKKIGKKGAVNRHKPMQELKAWAIEKYKGNKWASANAASYALKAEVMAYGKTIAATLTEQNAQRTIYSWFLGSDKPPSR